MRWSNTRTTVHCFRIRRFFRNVLAARSFNAGGSKTFTRHNLNYINRQRIQRRDKKKFHNATRGTPPLNEDDKRARLESPEKPVQEFAFAVNTVNLASNETMMEPPTPTIGDRTVIKSLNWEPGQKLHVVRVKHDGEEQWKVTGPWKNHWIHRHNIIDMDGAFYKDSDLGELFAFVSEDGDESKSDLRRPETFSTHLENGAEDADDMEKEVIPDENAALNQEFRDEDQNETKQKIGQNLGELFDQAAGLHPNSDKGKTGVGGRPLGSTKAAKKKKQEV